MRGGSVLSSREGPRSQPQAQGGPCPRGLLPSPAFLALVALPASQHTPSHPLVQTHRATQSQCLVTCHSLSLSPAIDSPPTPTAMWSVCALGCSPFGPTVLLANLGAFSTVSRCRVLPRDRGSLSDGTRVTFLALCLPQSPH